MIALLVDTVRQQFSPKGVMPSVDQSMHLQRSVGRNRAASLPGASVRTGVQHPATNTAESLPRPDRRGRIELQ